MEYTLERLKREYEELAEKHDLPAFDEITTHFDLESIRDEPLHLVRAVRRCMTFKSHDFFQFVETLVFPMNASPSVMRLASRLSAVEKTSLETIHTVLSEIEIHSISLEVTYHEVAEIAAIRHFFTLWKEHCALLDAVFAKLKTRPVASLARDKSYLG